MKYLLPTIIIRQVISGGSGDPGIQWFVYIINEIVGSNTTLTLQQVETAIKQLAGKGSHGKRQPVQAVRRTSLYPAEHCDNVLSVRSLRAEQNNEIVNSGFMCQSEYMTCCFSYNNKDIIFELFLPSG